MKIVVRGTNWIGDSVMTIPAMRELRRIFPNAHISLHIRSWAEGIFRDADFIDEILSFEKNRNAIATVRNQAKNWRGKEFDLAVVFTNSFQTALLSRLGRVNKRFGYKNEGRSFLLTNPIEKPSWKGDRHEVFYYINLITEIEQHYLGEKSSNDAVPNIKLNVSDERRKEAQILLERNGVDCSKKLVVLGVGSTNSRAKRWKPEGYAALNDKLKNDLDAEIILIGSEAEKDISQKVSSLAKHKPTILTGKTTLAEAVGILAEIDILVSNDMGLAHISAAVGSKTLTIFGPTNPRTTAPWDSEIIVRENLDCAPCMLRDCPIDHPCMKQISHEDVFARAKNLLY